MPDGPRARARAHTTAEIKRIAREHLAKDGPNLSLRAVARDLGVVSSAVYRYFRSRDELLTVLIIEGYDSLADAAEAAEASAPRKDLAGRWCALGRGIRAWALERPHEYALLYGSPVPGYAAPPDTIEPASRPLTLVAAIIREAVERGTAIKDDRLAKPVRADLDAIAATDLFAGVPAPVLARGITAWTELFGAINFELFGRLTNGITDYDAWFDHQLKAMGKYLGLS
jgi:AcrR family transcriptional regulator